MSIESIPLTKLVPSKANVRKTGTGIGIEELAASIAAHGLLQNLQVRARSADKFEVVAGGRRLAALKLLARERKIAKDCNIPCHILNTEDAGEISLAENTLRLPMHPADQFTAFHALAERGKGIEEIAARFGVSVAVVRQRLKLACVSPALINLYRDDQMSLDQLMAFTVSDNHEAQELAWAGQPEWRRHPSEIRRTLTATHIEAHDQRVRFVGLDTYLAAGGELVRDLFQPDHGGYLSDAALLDRLVNERLAAEAVAVHAEGWRWVETTPQLDWKARLSFQRIPPHAGELSPERDEERQRLTADYEALVAEHGEEEDEEIAEKIEALSAMIEAIGEEAMTWRAEDKAIAGAIVTIDRSGALDIQRGLVRPEDAKRRLTVIDGEGEEGDCGTNTERKPGLSAKLIEDLTAERTLALRALMMENHRIALATLAHALALPIFYDRMCEAASCLDLRLVSRDPRLGADYLSKIKAASLMDTRLAIWMERLPVESSALFGWLLVQDDLTITSLLALCTAMSLDAVRGKHDQAHNPRLTHADEVATSLGLDMVQWWEPTKEGYLGRVSKSMILDAVAEGVSKQAAENLMKLKKDALIVHAIERLAGKGWLPEILRPAATTLSNSESTVEQVPYLAAE